jgi:hypothetical protein
MAPKTWEPWRWPLVGTAGWRPRRAHVELHDPHWAKLASSANRLNPLHRLAARPIAGPVSCSHARRLAASR